MADSQFAIEFRKTSCGYHQWANEPLRCQINIWQRANIPRSCWLWSISVQQPIGNDPSCSECHILAGMRPQQSADRLHTRIEWEEKWISKTNSIQQNAHNGSQFELVTYESMEIERELQLKSDLNWYKSERGRPEGEGGGEGRKRLMELFEWARLKDCGAKLMEGSLDSEGSFNGGSGDVTSFIRRHWRRRRRGRRGGGGGGGGGGGETERSIQLPFTW